MINLKQRVLKILVLLKKTFPDAKCELIYKDAWQLLVAVILSAQCTDKRVNIVTPQLFKTFPTVKHFATAKLSSIEKEIQSTGFFRMKALAIQESARKIIADFGGKVPNEMEELLTLRGVARKTANVILSEYYGKNEGVIVDTHMIRLSNRLGLTKQQTPEKIEQDLMKIIPRKSWGLFSFMVVLLGRRICTARNPNCGGCPLNKICPSAFKV